MNRTGASGLDAWVQSDSACYINDLANSGANSFGSFPKSCGSWRPDDLRLRGEASDDPQMDEPMRR